MMATFSICRCSQATAATGVFVVFPFGYDGVFILGDRVGANKICSGGMFSRGYDDGYIPNFSM